MSGVVVASEGPPRVAYAIGRGAGNAVVRNRLRRRVRAAVRAEAPALRSGTAYLIGAGPSAAGYTMSELRATVRALAETTNGQVR